MLILDKRKLMLSIKQDVEFLAKHNLMDYSLLLTIEDQQQRIMRNVSAVDLDYLLESIEEENTSESQQDTVEFVNMMINTIESRASDISSNVCLSPNLKSHRRLSFRKSSFSAVQSQRKSAMNLRTNSVSVASLNAEEFDPDEHGNINWHVNSACGRFIYHIAIIDFLQRFDVSKKAERVAKSLKLKFKRNYEGFGPDDLSAMDPEKYKQRFYNFMKREVFKNIA